MCIDFIQFMKILIVYKNIPCTIKIINYQNIVLMAESYYFIYCPKNNFSVLFLSLRISYMHAMYFELTHLKTSL